jgi:hypothetical protein
MPQDSRPNSITLQSRVSNVLYAAHASFTVFPEPALTLPP